MTARFPQHHVLKQHTITTTPPNKQGVLRDASLDIERDPRGVTKANFPLPTLGPLLEALRDEVTRGRGFAFIRGFPVERYSRKEAIVG